MSDYLVALFCVLSLCALSLAVTAAPPRLALYVGVIYGVVVALIAGAVLQ